MMIPVWNHSYPDRRILRDEIRCMVETFVEVLLDELPEEAVDGIYFKGSAQKEWTSPLDYVPELSDIDLHLLFKDDSSTEKYIGTAGRAMHIQSLIEQRYFDRVPNPLHVPRPQLIILNKLLREPDYIPTPESTVTCLYGKEAPKATYDEGRVRPVDCERLRQEEEFLALLPLRFIDKPARYLWEAMRAIVWHVSPVAPRVLHLMELSTRDAWTMNRTAMVSRLNDMGESRLATDYSAFYLLGWRYFLSSYSDTDAGRASLLAGTKALARGVEIARAWLVEHPQNP